MSETPTSATPEPPPHSGSPAGAVRVAVHNGRCGHYGICVQEAPNTFELLTDHRLTYKTRAHGAEADALCQAARLCPMQAITVEQP